jgi:hypothetical protein
VKSSSGQSHSGSHPKRPITGSGLKPVVNSGIHQVEGPNGGGMNRGGGRHGRSR